MNAEEQRRKKTMREADTMAFTSQLFYYTVKAMVCFILYKYENILWNNRVYLCTFICLLLINAYFMMTTGNNPGFEPIQPMMDDQTNGFVTDLPTCAVCGCRQRPRTKHCYRCGRCVRKYDHHCPWTGSCVGENNHFRFFLLTLFHTVQALNTCIIFFVSLRFHPYKVDDAYGEGFGVFSIFVFFMVLYVLFAGGLMFFHGFLIASNLTTKELVDRHKCRYLDGIKGNPFNKGICYNFHRALFVPPEGQYYIFQYFSDWNIQNPSSSPLQRSFWSIIFDNQYYHCC